ncbi:Nephrocystin-3 [Durusdinium trenchii]|uniref:Nephrocystin-3 n=1 Tax=Durusdinium trenchii TaxID=1381693 RepID=A0ABP0P1E4_9DINO
MSQTSWSGACLEAELFGDRAACRELPDDPRGEMMPLSPAPAGCMAMGVAVSLVPFSVIERPATTGATPSLPSAPSFLGAALGLGAACDALGAKPLPLDAISSTGGSAVYGGPVDDGRLLMRERVMLTDIHDGRKKVFLRLPAAAMLRVAVVSGDAEATEVVLEDGNHQPIAPAESHIMGVGQAASYILEAGGALPGAQKREPNASVCGLEIVHGTIEGTLGVFKGDSTSALDLSKGAAVSSVPPPEGRVVVGGGAAATLALQLAEETLVEVEVQFNFLLSNVHLWLQTPGAGRSRAVRAPRVRALGLASAVRNARAVLRLRLHPGEHVVNFRHDPAFPKDAGPIKLVVAGGQCAPLALKLRRLRLPNARPVATAPMAPLAAGSDLVLRFALGHSTSRDGTEEALDAELGTAQFPVRPKASSAVGGNGGFVTVAWPSDVLEQVSQNSGAGHPVQVQDGASRIWALPLHFSGGNGEIWVALYRGKSGKPWAGGTAPPVSAPPVLWPADDREKAATALVGLGQTMPSTPQLAVSAPAPAAGFVSTRMLSWFVVLGLIVFYYLHSRPWQLLALMRRVQELGLFTRSEHVGGFASFEVVFVLRKREASSEMTNPWSWPAGTPSVIGTSGATARPARMCLGRGRAAFADAALTMDGWHEHIHFHKPNFCVLHLGPKPPDPKRSMRRRPEPVFRDGDVKLETHDSRPGRLEVERLRETLASNEARFGRRHAETLSAVTCLAQCLEEAGKLKEAEPLYRRALAGQVAQLGSTDPLSLRATRDLACLLEEQGNIDEAEALCWQGMAGCETQLGAMHPDTLISVFDLGRVLKKQKKLDTAEPLLRQALAGQEAQLGAEDEATLASVDELASLLEDQGKLEEAELLLRRALSGREVQLGSVHPKTLTSVNNLAVFLHNKGKLEEAERFARRAVACRSTALGAAHPETLCSVHGLGRVLRQRRKTEEAETLLRRAVLGRERQLGGMHLSTLASVHELAKLLEERNLEEAEFLLRRVVEGRERQLGEGHGLTLEAIFDLAELLATKGDELEAERLYLRELDAWEELLGCEHPKSQERAENLERFRRRREPDEGKTFEGITPMSLTPQLVYQKVSLREYFRKHYQKGGLFLHREYQAEADWCWLHEGLKIKVWQDALHWISLDTPCHTRCTRGGASGANDVREVDCFFHYTTELGFRNITSPRTTSDMLASLIDGKRANTWGKGVYCVQKAPDEWPDVETLIDNHYRSMLKREIDLKGSEMAIQECRSRVAFCIPVLVKAAHVYDVSKRGTPEMLEKGRPASTSLVGKPNEPGKPPRDCAVLRVDGDVDYAARLTETLRGRVEALTKRLGWRHLEALAACGRCGAQGCPLGCLCSPCVSDCRHFWQVDRPL